MATEILQQIRRAVGNLNPQEIRTSAGRPLAVLLVASDADGYRAMETFLSPPGFSRKKRFELSEIVYRATDRAVPDTFDIEIYEAGLDCPSRAFQFFPETPEQLVPQVLEQHEELGLALARNFAPFREPVVDRIVHDIARENAIFSLATALPNIMPAGLTLPWGVAEMGSDTAFLTVNQIRMLFLLAGASDRDAGYREQRGEIASVIAGAFGWRSLARELVGKIPFGGGLIPKAAVAFAGTYVVGRSAERFYRIGYGYSRQERRVAYEEALLRGKAVVGSLLRREPRQSAA
jgi:hypothetical protein